MFFPTSSSHEGCTALVIMSAHLQLLLSKDERCVFSAKMELRAQHIYGKSALPPSHVSGAYPTPHLFLFFWVLLFVLRMEPQPEPQACYPRKHRPGWPWTCSNPPARQSPDWWDFEHMLHPWLREGAFKTHNAAVRICTLASTVWISSQPHALTNYYKSSRLKHAF